MRFENNSENDSDRFLARVNERFQVIPFFLDAGKHFVACGIQMDANN
jgi:hypothetical protein